MAEEEIRVDVAGQFGYKCARVFPSRGVGTGSYGSVCRAALDELPCVAKLLHATFFSSYDPSAAIYVERFEQESRFLSTLRHPCIVQFLGLVREPRSARPILLMELMDESLTKFLERQPRALSYHVQLNLVHDVAMALAYLHSNQIVHRDLSSNNVLITTGSRAKVTDFGMSRIVDANPHMTPLTQCPGTLAFMPPEALLASSLYLDKLDIFSAGVLMIQIITRRFPTPTESKRVVNFPASPTGVIEVPVPERERRNHDIVRVATTHPLLPLALQCLKNKDGERPSAAQMCSRLAALRDTEAYTDSLQETTEDSAHQGRREAGTKEEGEIKELRENLQSVEEELQATVQQLAEKENIVRAKEQEIRETDREVEDARREAEDARREAEGARREVEDARKEAEGARREAEGARREAEGARRVVEDMQQLLAESQSRLLKAEGEGERREEGVRKGKRERKRKRERVQESGRLPVVAKSQQGTTPKRGNVDLGKLNLQCRSMENAPEGMCRGSAVSNGNTIYCIARYSYTIFTFQTDKNEWETHSQCPHSHTALTTIGGCLTAIGGKRKGFLGGESATSKVVSWKGGKWVEEVPPMWRARWDHALVSDGSTVIIAGGEDEASVEVFHVLNRTWSRVAGLPRSLYSITATLRGDLVYVMDYDGNIYTSFLTALLSSRPTPSTRSTWRPLNTPPVRYSTLCTIGSQVVVVGGVRGVTRTANVHALDNDDLWISIGSTSTARILPIVTSFNGDQNLMVVVGGYLTFPSKSVELCELHFS